MPVNTTQRAFVQQHAGQRLDLGKLAQQPQAKQALEQAGVSLDKVKQAAGADGVLSAEEAAAVIEQLAAGQQSAATEALGRLLADPGLQPIDRANSVFGAMLSSKVDAPAPVAKAEASTVVEGTPAVDLNRPVTLGAPGDTGQDALVYVSANSVEDQGVIGSGGTSSPLSALGSYGPLGAYGPLGELGPVGDNVWNPSTWIDAANNSWGSSWDGRADGGPLTEAGPLGSHGPLGDAYIDGALFENNEAAQQLRGLGQAAVLGPLGPLGPLGALGPLGPVGAHGFGTDENGSYIDRDGKVQRTIDVFYNDDKTEVRSYELFEKYSEEAAKAMTDNDTSFMVEGGIAYEGRGKYETDEFEFTSNSDQLVTVCVVPEKSLDDFDLEIVDDKGNVLAKSDSDDLMDWTQLQVKKGTKLKARVKLKDSGHWFSKTYRLYVVGSGEELGKAALNSGEHVRTQGE
jgi:hypothetical protein